MQSADERAATKAGHLAVQMASWRALKKAVKRESWRVDLMEGNWMEWSCLGNSNWVPSLRECCSRGWRRREC